MPQETYPKAPITEAVIELRFESSANESELASAAKHVGDNYEHSDTVQVSEEQKIDLVIKPNRPATLGNTEIKFAKHFRMTSFDQTQRCLITPSSFLVSQLAPYAGWDQYFSRFTRDFKIFTDKSGFRKKKRIGVRYMNRLDVPSSEPVVQHEKYVSVFSQTPETLGPSLWYRSSSLFPVDEINGKLLLTTSSIQSPLSGHMGILIDIDVSVERDIPQSPAAVLDLLNNIRRIKNNVFESCISDSARELFRK